MLRSSRELSSRVEIGGHARPNRFRRATWWLALWAAVGSLLWVSWQSVLGEHHIFQAGPVSVPHRLIENDCSRCHTTWTPLKRLIGISRPDDDARDNGHSIDSANCESCHRVAVHHDNQVPAHRDISCAACHREHAVAEMLTRPSSRYCVGCHTDLKTTHGPTETFAKRVTRFDEVHGHPDFALHRLATSDADDVEVSQKHPARKILEHFLRPGEPAARWQDRGRVRFNHAAHLKAEYDASGKLIYGLIGKDRKFTDLSRSCENCHEPDHERRFMKPISYDRHCKECHPLLFDNDRFPGQSVPHRSPDVVCGFLTEVYTLRTLRGEAPPVKPLEDQIAEKIARPIPGHRDFARLTKDQAAVVSDDLARAEQLAQQHRHGLFGYEASGGCRYCHQVEPVESKGPTEFADWRVVPPNIPERWLLDGEFHHEPHRLLSCTACHADVGTSKSTGDVLIPSINVCRACHSERPHGWAEELPRQKSEVRGQRSAKHSLKELLSGSMHGARFDCVECHRYHNPTKERLNGHFEMR